MDSQPHGTGPAEAMETPVRRSFLKTAALGVAGASLTPCPGARQPGRTAADPRMDAVRLHQPRCPCTPAEPDRRRSLSRPGLSAASSPRTAGWTPRRCRLRSCRTATNSSLIRKQISKELMRRAGGVGVLAPAGTSPRTCLGGWNPAPVSTAGKRSLAPAGRGPVGYLSLRGRRRSAGRTARPRSRSRHGPRARVRSAASARHR